MADEALATVLGACCCCGWALILPAAWLAYQFCKLCGEIEKKDWLDD